MAWRDFFSGAVAMLIACLLFYASNGRALLSEGMITALAGAVVGALLAVVPTILTEERRQKAAAKPFLALLVSPAQAVTAALWSMEAMIKEKVANGETSVSGLDRGVEGLRFQLEESFDILRAKFDTALAHLTPEAVVAFGRLELWVGVCVDYLRDGFSLEDGAGMAAEAVSALKTFQRVLPSSGVKPEVPQV